MNDKLHRIIERIDSGAFRKLKEFNPEVMNPNNYEDYWQFHYYLLLYRTFELSKALYDVEATENIGEWIQKVITRVENPKNDRERKISYADTENTYKGVLLALSKTLKGCDAVHSTGTVRMNSIGEELENILYDIDA